MTTTVKTQLREKGKQSNLTKLRGEGFVPAVVYGYNTDASSIAVSQIDLLKTLREVGRNGVMQLDIDGKAVNVVLSDYQMDVLKGNILHADFLAINMTDELEVSVTVVTTGDSVGVSKGGILNQPNRELVIKVKPSAIPDSIEVDVTDLAIGDILRVVDIREKCEFNILNEDDYALIAISSPRTDEELETSADEPAVAADAENETDSEKV
ncbi:50S ribosomal protein L25/general stress protein Ctc [Paenisporosarcina sp. TG20]|uniref:50S ribosomal protein L25/general stress protein Ctc n=1 Tax=Paenisporosarcina sp. TG20 TaxID=1211706 RepID=UPI00030A474F|nr:50S ribosomal protein L25/general stress protein Ctc [Paenisporosarcina sp. TG20]